MSRSTRQINGRRSREDGTQHTAKPSTHDAANSNAAVNMRQKGKGMEETVGFELKEEGGGGNTLHSDSRRLVSKDLKGQVLP